jgi:hypothetical protein
MNDLPRAARYYLIATWLIAAISVGWALSVPTALFDNALLLALVFLCYVLGDFFEVKIDRRPRRSLHDDS